MLPAITAIARLRAAASATALRGVPSSSTARLLQANEAVESIEIPLRSSALASAAYAPLELELTVRFTDGTSAAYSGITPDVVLGLLTAPSQGLYFNTFIRDR